MNQDSSINEPETLFELSHQLLSSLDFSGSRKFALMAGELVPNLPGIKQIVAITDILLAAENRLPENHIDHYSILQIPQADSDTEHVITTQFEKLKTLLNPSKNTIPFCPDALNLVYEAWSVLSDPEKKTQYDKRIHGQNPLEFEPESKFKLNEEENDNDKKRKLGFGIENVTFWTVCPYCYWVYEFDKVYEECSLRCMKCRKSFHGAAVPELPESAVVKGKEEYYCAVGYFEVKYFLNGKKTKSVDCYTPQVNNVVEISSSDDDDDDDDEKKVGLKRDYGGIDEGKLMVSGNYNGKRVKSVARYSKKIMGKGIKSVSSQDLKVGKWSDNDEVDFIEEDDDIYVCV